MYKMIYTRTLDNADEIIAESWEYQKKEDAIEMFNERVSNLMKTMLNNEFMHVDMNMHKHRALIKVESVHHCFAVVDDMNKAV